MKKMRNILFIIPFLFISATAPYSFTLVVSKVSTLTTSGNPSILSIKIPVSGSAQAVDSSTTYKVISNTGGSGSLKITGMISGGGNMPTNTSLTIKLGSSKGTSLGAVALSTTSADLVTGLSTHVTDAGSITYAFNVTSGWTVPAQALVRTVTLTLTSSS